MFIWWMIIYENYDKKKHVCMCVHCVGINRIITTTYHIHCTGNFQSKSFIAFTCCIICCNCETFVNVSHPQLVLTVRYLILQTLAFCLLYSGYHLSHCVEFIIIHAVVWGKSLLPNFNVKPAAIFNSALFQKCSNSNLEIMYNSEAWWPSNNTGSSINNNTS